jgi:hypothetical protein
MRERVTVLCWVEIDGRPIGSQHAVIIREPPDGVEAWYVALLSISPWQKRLAPGLHGFAGTLRDGTRLTGTVDIAETTLGPTYLCLDGRGELKLSA